MSAIAIEEIRSPVLSDRTHRADRGSSVNASQIAPQGPRPLRARSRLAEVRFVVISRRRVDLHVRLVVGPPNARMVRSAVIRFLRLHLGLSGWRPGAETPVNLACSSRFTGQRPVIRPIFFCNLIPENASMVVCCLSA